VTNRAARGAIAVAALLMLVLPSAGATPHQPAPTSQSDVLHLVSQTPAVEPDGDFTIRLRLAGAPSGSKVEVQVHDRVPTRSDFATSLTGRNLRRTIGTPTVVPATPDASGTVAITIGTRDSESTAPTDPTRLRLSEGVYPVTIALLDAKGTTLDDVLSYLVRLPVSQEFGPIGVAIVLPVGGPPALQPDGSVTLPSATAQSVLNTSSVLAAHPGVPVTVAATAETIDALAPGDADALRTAVSGRLLSWTPFARLRIADWVAAGLRDELAHEFDTGTHDLTTALAPPDQTIVVADDSLTTDAARELHARGVRSIVAPAHAFAALDERVFNRTLTQPFALDGVDGLTAFAADDALAAHVGETGDPVLDANHLLADIAVLYFDDPPSTRATVVSLADDRPVDPTFLDAVLTALTPGADRIVAPMTLTRAFTTVPRAGSRGETTGRGAPLTRRLTPVPSNALSSFAPRMRDANSALGSYRGMVAGANSRPDELDRRLLVAGDHSLSEDQKVAYLDGAKQSVSQELAKIAPPNRQTINFTARDGVVSFTIRNDTGYPVNLTIFLQGDKLEFPGHENGAVAVTLADPATRVSLNVRARASGDSPLDLAFTSPDGQLVVGRTRVTIRSTAFSGVGLVLSVGSGLFLAVWWLRHAVTSRRARRRQLRHAAPGGRRAAHREDATVPEAT
jgi:hypothetical protein